MTDAMRNAIEAADVETLQTLVTLDTTLATADVSWDDGSGNSVPPLHFVCDAVFRGLATQEEGLAMANVLLGAGVNPEQSYARSGDTFLIAAASLGAETIGLRLLELGVDVEPRGLFEATALHWAAYMGLDRLADALAKAGSELELRDTQYECTPLEWALHAWRHGANGGRHEGLPLVVEALVSRGAKVPSGTLEVLIEEADAPMRAALLTAGPD